MTVKVGHFCRFGNEGVFRVRHFFRHGYEDVMAVGGQCPGNGIHLFMAVS